MVAMVLACIKKSIASRFFHWGAEKEMCEADIWLCALYTSS